MSGLEHWYLEGAQEVLENPVTAPGSDQTPLPMDLWGLTELLCTTHSFTGKVSLHGHHYKNSSAGGGGK